MNQRLTSGSSGLGVASMAFAGVTGSSPTAFAAPLSYTVRQTLRARMRNQENCNKVENPVAMKKGSPKALAAIAQQLGLTLDDIVDE